MGAVEAGRRLALLSDEEILALAYEWRFWGRPEQFEPPDASQPGGKDWYIWLYLAGRGSGKTRSGAEWVTERVRAGARRISLIGRTVKDVRETMLYGESGIMTISPPALRPVHKRSDARLEWPTGAVGILYSADTPKSQRGPNADTIWADELAAWQYPDSFTQMMLTLRSVQSGLQPRAMISTTPVANSLIRSLVADPSVSVTRGTTFDNLRNLHPTYIEYIKRKFAGTRLGQQEIYGQLLTDTPGALWKQAWIDPFRITLDALPPLVTVVIAVDPATSTGPRSDETGIIVAGVGVDGRGYVLYDGSGRYSPDEWGKHVVSKYIAYKAKRLIAETNQGGDMVMSTIDVARRDFPHAPFIHYELVHAKVGKRARAEPVAALYEQGRISHVGYLGALEAQLTTWQPDIILDPDAEEGGIPVGDELEPRARHVKSPDRLDALVYALTDLMVDRDPKARAGRGAVKSPPGFNNFGGFQKW